MRRDRMPTVKVAQSAGVIVRCKCGRDLRLLLHKDAKTSPGVFIEEKNGRVTARAEIPNAFPLPAGPVESGGACPGFTRACKDCYGAGLERYPGFQNGAVANLAALRELYECAGFGAVVSALVEVVNRSGDLQRVAGVARPVFRWHSDGDIFSPWYARAIRRAMVATPGVDHWLYTRSLSLVRYLMPVVDNARVYLSADRYNVDAVARLAKRYGLPVAMLADDTADASALWAKVVAVAPVPSPVLCPAVGKWAHDGHRIPAHVTGPDGRRSSAKPNGPGVGACVACGVCLPGGTRSVTFTVHGGISGDDSEGRLGAAIRVRIRNRAGVTS